MACLLSFMFAPHVKWALFGQVKTVEVLQSRSLKPYLALSSDGSVFLQCYHTRY